MRANESDFFTVRSPRRRRRLAGTGFFAVAAALVPAQCKPAPAPAPLPVYTPPAASSSAATDPAGTTATTATTATPTTPTTTATTNTPLVASAAPVPTPAGTTEPAATDTTVKANYPPAPEPTTTTATTTPPPARTCAGPAAAAGTNLLVNPSFEDGGPLATGWLDESTTVGAAIYSISTTHGVVDGSRAQAFTYVGAPDDDGLRKAQFYQAPISGVVAGQRVQFSICATAAGTGPASMVRSYAAIGVEAFRADGTYLSDVAMNITRLDATPTRYIADYVIPDGTGYLAVFIQSPEVYATSVFDIVFDQASLVVIP